MMLIDAHLILSGAHGKMGQAIQALAPQYFKGHIYDAKHLAGVAREGSMVWIDFSHEKAFDSVVEGLKHLQIPCVMGTTGLTPNQQETLKTLSQTLPILYDTNFSIGIGILRQLIAALPKTSLFDITIFESHHRNKADKPSGTAKTLQADIKQHYGEQMPIDMLSHRGGGVFGQHQIILTRQHEKITLTHEAFDRTVFAEGTLQAAQWILRQKPGFYQMRDFYHDRLS